MGEEGAHPTLTALEEPRMAGGGRSAWHGALGDRGSPSPAQAVPFSPTLPSLGPSLPVPPRSGRGGGAEAAPASPEGAPELRQSPGREGRGWDVLQREESCCCLDLSEC